MNALNFQSLRSSLNEIKTSIISISTEWAGRIIARIKIAQPYLKDPRIASAAIFGMNFAILLLADRMNQLVTRHLPTQTMTQKRIKLAIRITVGCSLTVVGNIAFITATGVMLNRLILAAIITTTFIAKYNLDNYLKQSIADKT